MTDQGSKAGSSSAQARRHPLFTHSRPQRQRPKPYARIRIVKWCPPCRARRGSPRPLGGAAVVLVLVLVEWSPPSLLSSSAQPVGKAGSWIHISPVPGCKSSSGANNLGFALPIRLFSRLHSASLLPRPAGSRCSIALDSGRPDGTHLTITGRLGRASGQANVFSRGGQRHGVFNPSSFGAASVLSRRGRRLVALSSPSLRKVRFGTAGCQASSHTQCSAVLYVDTVSLLRRIQYFLLFTPNHCSCLLFLVSFSSPLAVDSCHSATFHPFPRRSSRLVVSSSRCASLVSLLVPAREGQLGSNEFVFVSASRHLQAGSAHADESAPQPATQSALRTAMQAAAFDGVSSISSVPCGVAAMRTSVAANAEAMHSGHKPF
ncbi:uncharacterized protein J3D65DRAFT_427025 [Phyllosticta citribraziliensis]|uniref:Transmembrane protein n=1 Tax=Phyllosticta citribraziliensis TaxID=989973 RepID=A0ABR1LJG5_9PEZI